MCFSFGCPWNWVRLTRFQKELVYQCVCVCVRAHVGDGLLRMFTRRFFILLYFSVMLPFTSFSGYLSSRFGRSRNFFNLLTGPTRTSMDFFLRKTLTVRGESQYRLTSHAVNRKTVVIIVRHASLTSVPPALMMMRFFIPCQTVVSSGPCGRSTETKAERH